MPVVMVIVIVVVFAVVVFVATGRGGELSAERADYVPLDLGPVSATDIALLRPPGSLWGYNMQATDAAMEQIAESVRERDVRIVALEQLVTDLSRDHTPALPLGSPYTAARHRRSLAEESYDPPATATQPALPSAASGPATSGPAATGAGVAGQGAAGPGAESPWPPEPTAALAADDPWAAAGAAPAPSATPPWSTETASAPSATPPWSDESATAPAATPPWAAGSDPWAAARGTAIPAEAPEQSAAPEQLADSGQPAAPAPALPPWELPTPAPREVAVARDPVGDGQAGDAGQAGQAHDSSWTGQTHDQAASEPVRLDFDPGHPGSDQPGPPPERSHD